MDDPEPVQATGGEIELGDDDLIQPEDLDDDEDDEEDDE